MQVNARALVTVVDDDESLRRSVENLLSSVGMEVATLASAEAFLTSSSLDETRCLVLDLRMEGMSGLELVARLAALGKPIPFILLTAHGDQDVRQQALKAGAIAFLTKPFRADDLVNALRTVLGPGP
ncbi:MAG TPA: response regulator [Polyangiaceae bacterium]|nr:response regulator [Polyangiaceae bacterium]